MKRLASLLLAVVLLPLLVPAALAATGPVTATPLGGERVPEVVSTTPAKAPQVSRRMRTWSSISASR